MLETFPNTFTWRRLVDQTTRANLVAKLQDAKDKFNLMAPDAEQMQRSDAALEVLKATLDVVQLDLSQDNVAAGFGVLRAAEDAARSLYVEEKEPEDQVVRQHLSQFFELLGTEAQFKSLPAFALRCYRHSYALSELNFSVQLKLAALYLELDVESAAVAIYERLLSGSGPVGKEVAVDDGSAAETDDVSVNSRRSTGSFSSQVLPLGLSLDSPKLRQAWTQLHRAALYVQRQADGKYLPDAVTKAVDALEQLVLAPLGKSLCPAAVSAYSQGLFPTPACPATCATPFGSVAGVAVLPCHIVASVSMPSRLLWRAELGAALCMPLTNTPLDADDRARH